MDYFEDIDLDTILSSINQSVPCSEGDADSCNHPVVPSMCPDNSKRHSCPIPECKGKKVAKLWNHIYLYHAASGNFTGGYLSLLLFMLKLDCVIGRNRAKARASGSGTLSVDVCTCTCTCAVHGCAALPMFVG